MGASVILVERGRMGGDCLNFGCVPSKALLAAGRAAQAARQSERFGIDASVRPIEGERIHEHVHGVIAKIAPHDSVGTVRGSRRARNARPRPLRRRRSRSKWRAACSRPPICHRNRVVAARFRPFLAFNPSPSTPTRRSSTCRYLPERLLVIGGGAVGVELGQAFQRTRQRSDTDRAGNDFAAR